MTMELLLQVINYFSREAKHRALTEDEQSLQKQLRQVYLQKFRQAFRQQVEKITIIDENGADVTPNKLKRIQKAQAMHQNLYDLPEKMEIFLKEL